MKLWVSLLCFVVLVVSQGECRGRFRTKGKIISRTETEDGELFNIHRGHGNKHKRQHKTLKAETEVDFLSRRVRTDGEIEIRLAYRGVKVLETQLPDVGEKGLFLREVTDGNRVVKAVFQGKDALVDCDILKGLEDVEKFVLKFLEPEYLGDYLQQVSQGPKHANRLSLPAKTNTTFRVLQKGQLDADQTEMVNFKEIKTACRMLHQQIRRIMKEERRKKKQESKKTEDDSATTAHSRSKRSMFIYPGTNWCGTGNVASGYNDLGDSFDTDKCCRQHDHCPHTIEGFSTAYNMFNYRFHTLSHCNCDESFRHCLRTTSSPTSKMVGRLYFNMMGLRCFTLKPQSVCLKRSWWGTCTLWDKQYTAIVQEAKNF